MHSMKYIYQAREKGRRSWLSTRCCRRLPPKPISHLRVRPFSRFGALALGMARATSWSKARDQILSTTMLTAIRNLKLIRATSPWSGRQICASPAMPARQLAEATAVKMATVWIGYGMQRHVNEEAAPAFALSARFRRYDRQHRLSKAAARVMVICTHGALTTTPCCRSRR